MKALDYVAEAKAQIDLEEAAAMKRRLERENRKKEVADQFRGFADELTGINLVTEQGDRYVIFRSRVVPAAVNAGEVFVGTDGHNVFIVWGEFHPMGFERQSLSWYLVDRDEEGYKLARNVTTRYGRSVDSVEDVKREIATVVARLGRPTMA